MRFPRLAQAAALIALAMAPIAAAILPAYADSWWQTEWWLSKLHVTQAWRSSEGAGVTVAVLADGVDGRQPDLIGSVIQGRDFTRSGRTASGPYFGVIGTGVASLIAGHGHGRKAANGKHVDGIYGVAGNARILSVRVTLSPGDPLWSSTQVTSRLPGDIAAGIRYAVAHNASVIELPADPGMPGLSHWGGAPAAAGGSAAERTAIAYAVRHDVVLVAPAGDNGQAGDAPNYPAAYRGVIAVGAFGRNFVKARYSSHRKYVTLTAAGIGVTAAAPVGYQTMNSTWAASAIVAGVASLIRSQFPNLTASQVLKAMTDGTAYQPHSGLLDGSGHGTVDARKAITDAATMSPPHARPASLGALPWRRPVAPPVPSQESILARDLISDGAISAGALAGLLVPIAWYGSAVRRRERREALAAAERERGRPPRPDQGTMLADPLLEFFGPQHPRPVEPLAGQRPAASPRYQPRPALSGRSTLSPGPSAFVPRAMLPAPPAAGLAGPAGAASLAGAPMLSAPAEPPRAVPPWESRVRPAADGEPDAWTGSDPLRHVPVAGSPPWEPAPRPTTELPWAMIPGPSAGPARRGGPSVPTSQAPPESVWETRPATAATAAPRSVFDPGSPQDLPDGEADRGRLADSGSHPIYIWNPRDSRG